MASYSDGDFTVAAANGAKNFVFPFEGDNRTFYYNQEFIQLAASYSPLALNTQDPDDLLAYLTKEDGLTDIGGGLVKFNRTYCSIPYQRNDFESFVYTFPGFAATLTNKFQSPYGLIVELLPTVLDPGRVPLAIKVTSRLQYDYFLVGTPNGGFSSAKNIPIIPAQRYFFGSAWPTKAGQDLPDRILYQSSLANYSTPTVEEWKSLITNGTEIVADYSEVKRWKGNIFERMTRYVVAR